MLERLEEIIQLLPPAKSEAEWKKLIAEARFVYNIKVLSGKSQEVFLHEAQVQGLSNEEFKEAVKESSVFSNEIVTQLLSLVMAIQRKIISEWKEGKEYLPPEVLVPVWVDLLPDGKDSLEKLEKVFAELLRRNDLEVVGAAVATVCAAIEYKKQKVAQGILNFEVILSGCDDEVIFLLGRVYAAQAPQPEMKADEMKQSVDKIRTTYGYMTDKVQTENLVRIQDIQRECELLRAECQQFANLQLFTKDETLYSDFFNRPDLVRSEAMVQLVKIVNSQPADAKGDLEKRIKTFANDNPAFAKAIRNIGKLCHLLTCVCDNKLTPTERLNVCYKDFYASQYAMERVGDSTVDKTLDKFNAAVKNVLSVLNYAISEAVKTALHSVSGYFYVPRVDKADKKREEKAPDPKASRICAGNKTVAQ
jgi:hypothetical protein